MVGKIPDKDFKSEIIFDAEKAEQGAKKAEKAGKKVVKDAKDVANKLKESNKKIVENYKTTHNKLVNGQLKYTKTVKDQVSDVTTFTSKGYKRVNRERVINEEITNNKVIKINKTAINKRKAMLEDFGRYSLHWAMRFGMMFAVFKVVDLIREMTAETIAAARQMDQLSKITGFSVEALSGLDIAARKYLITTEQLQRALAYMGKSMSLLGQEGGGKGRVAWAYRQLGLTFEQLKDLKPEDQLKLITERFVKLTDANTKAGVAIAVFERSGREMIPILEDLGREFDEYDRIAKRTGAYFTKEFTDAAVELGQEFETLKKHIQGAGISLGKHTVKEMSTFVRALNEYVIPAIKWKLNYNLEQAKWLLDTLSYLSIPAFIKKAKELADELEIVGLQSIKSAEIDITDIFPWKAEELKNIGTEAKKTSATMTKMLETIAMNVVMLKIRKDDEAKAARKVAEALREELTERARAEGALKRYISAVEQTENKLLRYVEQLRAGTELTAEQKREFNEIIDVMYRVDGANSVILTSVQDYIDEINVLVPALKDYKERLAEIMALQLTMAGFPTTPWQLMGSGGKEIEKTFKEGFMAPFKEMEERLTNMKTLGESVGNSLVSGINRASSGLASLIVFGGKFKDVMKDALKETLADLIKIGIQFLIMKTFKLDFTRGAVELGVASTGLIVAGGVISASAKELAAAAALLVAAKLLPFEKGGYVSKGPGSLPKIPKAQKGLITPSNVSDGGMLAILHKNELVLPKPYVGDFFKTAAEKLFFSGRVPSVVPSMASTGGYAPNVYVNIYSPDLTDYVQLKNVARKIGDEIEKDQRRRVV